MNILGISCFYHDAGACLLRDGQILAAAEEERFSRRKHDSGFPEQAVRYCLEAGDLVAEELDHVIFYEKPLLKFERIAASYAATFPRSRQVFVEAMQTWLSEKLWVRSQIRKRLGYSGRILFGEHHLSHAASAYFPSPFAEAAVVTADGVGEWSTTTLGVGSDLDLELTHELHFPHSLGLLYSAFTAYLGFEVNEGEYKVMGMAAYGQPTYVDKIRQLVRQAEDGSFHLDMRYFGYHQSLRSITRAFTDLLGPPRPAEAGLDQKYADIAASLQLVTEEIMVGLTRQARSLTGSDNLCLAGGVALNVLANAKILRESGFLNVWIQPAAGDSGGCIGAATQLYHSVLRQPRTWTMTDAYLGPGYSNDEIGAFLSELDVSHTVLRGPELTSQVARLLADGNVVGWFQGRMEFGPRALGARSILANPTDPGDEGQAQRQDQAPRAVPPLRAERAERGRLDVLRLRRPVDRPREPVHAAGGEGPARQAAPGAGHHPRRRHGARADGRARAESALLRPDRGVRQADRRAGAGQHLVQRPRRADRVHAGGGVQLVLAHGYGLPGHGRRADPGQLQAPAQRLPRCYPDSRRRRGGCLSADGRMTTQLTGGRKAALLVLPWLFLIVFAYLYFTIILPRGLSGHLIGACFGLFAGHGVGDLRRGRADLLARRPQRTLSLSADATFCATIVCPSQVKCAVSMNRSALRSFGKIAALSITGTCSSAAT